ncbi:MAG TPA: transglycosylase SLT domain-containing protein [Woeseiaceae bacterium]|nr:transglycosylase SLT domain-containing protein [Woeseiaceae bacterium]
MNAMLLTLATLPLMSIPSAYRTAADAAAVPAPILYAIALTESGQPLVGGLRPWPWSLNVAGDSQFFTSRRDAWLCLQQALAVHRNVDVGLMQVSWRYHADELDSPWQALHPQWNLAVGAAILKDCFDDRQNWSLAIGCYHAPNDPTRASAYRERVERHLSTIERN